MRLSTGQPVLPASPPPNDEVIIGRVIAHDAFGWPIVEWLSSQRGAFRCVEAPGDVVAADLTDHEAFASEYPQETNERFNELHEQRLAGENGDGRHLTVAERQEYERLEREQADHPLLTAYHAVYDEKDRHPLGSEPFYQAYLALQALEKVLETAGLDIPTRHDKERTS